MDTVKEMIETEFSRRLKRNRRYSLRAFARSLGVSHTLLSFVLSGKRKASPALLAALENACELAPTSLAAHSKRAIAAASEREFQKITLDAFSFISEWYHYAILSLTELPDFKMQASWISKELGISRAEAKLGLERLKRLKLIEFDGRRWKQMGKPLKVENTVSTNATRQFHRQMLERAQEALDGLPMSVRDFSSITLAMDPKSLPFALLRIRRFRRQLCRELERMGTPKAVYQLGVQIFPLSRLKENQV